MTRTRLTRSTPSVCAALFLGEGEDSGMPFMVREGKEEESCVLFVNCCIGQRQKANEQNTWLLFLPFPSRLSHRFSSASATRWQSACMFTCTHTHTHTSTSTRTQDVSRSKKIVLLGQNLDFLHNYCEKRAFKWPN